MSESKPVSLRDIAYVGFRYRWQVTIIVIVSVLGAFGYLLYAPPIYVAETKLLVQIGHEKFAALEAYNRDQINVVFQERGENITNEMEILRDPHLVYELLPSVKEYIAAAQSAPQSLWQRIKGSLRAGAKWVKNALRAPFYWLGLSTRLSPDDALAMDLTDAIRLEFLELTDIIKISLAAPDPQFAAYLLNQYTDAYLRRRAEVLRGGDSKAFYDEQTELYEHRLLDAERALKKFKHTAGITSILLQKDLLLKQATQLEGKLAELALARRETQVARAAVSRAGDDPTNWVQTPDLGASTPDLSAPDREYFALLGERNARLVGLAADSEEVRRLDRRLARLRAEKVATLMRFLDTRLATLDAKSVLVKDELSAKRERLAGLDGSEMQLAELERQKMIAETNFLTYKKKAEQLRVSSELDEKGFVSVHLLSRALPPSKPSFPRKTLILGLSLFLGLFASFAYAVVAHFFDHTFRNPEEVETILGIPIFGNVPEVRPSTG